VRSCIVVRMPRHNEMLVRFCVVKREVKGEIERSAKAGPDKLVL